MFENINSGIRTILVLPNLSKILISGENQLLAIYNLYNTNSESIIYC